jgi:rhodanese-related sulfurtransferase
MSFEHIQEIDLSDLSTWEDRGALIVDVREADEVEEGMIPGATHQALSQFPEYQESMPKDKDIVFYCRSGKRSLKAAHLASHWTDKTVVSLTGGYLAYSARS